MKVPDQINRLKVVTKERLKRITKSHLSKRDSFILFGIEALFKSKIEYQVKKNKNHYINRKNEWKYGRKNLIIIEAEKEAEHFIKTHSSEEVENVIIKNIEQGKVDIKILPSKAQSYYKQKSEREASPPLIPNKEIDQKQDKKSNPLPKKTPPLTKNQIIELEGYSIEKYNENISLEFDAVYVKMPDNRIPMEKKWAESLQNSKKPFFKIYYQDFLDKVQLFKARQRLDNQKKQSKDNDLEL